MLESINIRNVLFLDIETVSAFPGFSHLSERMKEHWTKKSRFILRSDEDHDPEVIAGTYSNRAAIYAEFGKIVCISIGYIHGQNGDLRLKSFYDVDEQALLRNFSLLMEKHYHDPKKQFICGHNIKEFDIPYLCRRYMINGLPLPSIFQIAGKKPWETKHLLDTMQLWKFGDIKNYTSLDLLATVFEIETPKDDIDGSMVGDVFWKENDLERIAKYCEKDVVTVAQVLLKMKGMDPVSSDKIVSV